MRKRFTIGILTQGRSYFLLFISGIACCESLASGSPQASPSFNVLPQYPQVTPSLLSQGLCEAQVPLNSPFFKKIRRTDSSIKNRANIPMVRKYTAIWKKLTFDRLKGSDQVKNTLLKI
jgi:hypothetical protein